MTYEIRINRLTTNLYGSPVEINETLSRARNYGEAVVKFNGYCRDLGSDGIIIVDVTGATVHTASPLRYAVGTAAPAPDLDDYPF